MRIKGALKAEQNPASYRIRSMYETGTDFPLPIFWVRDPLLKSIRNSATANAHDFDSIYELDRFILWEETQEFDASQISLPNNDNTTLFVTNTEVQDFLSYLEKVIFIKPSIKLGAMNLSGEDAVSMIKQILGIEKKKMSTAGGFPPYFISSMYYARPDSPSGDEMLGRTWFYMKKIASNEKDAELNKESVIFALLDSVEMLGNSLYTHCQTRITGELMKLLSWYLPGSKLPSFVAAEDLPQVQCDQDVTDRIEAAPFRAQQLFNHLKKEDSGGIRNLVERHIDQGTDPQLWERYEAYYDALYRRARDDDREGYKRDENILMRDERGNLVSAFNADGSLRENPLIIYYQAEFQVFEHVFTQLMKREFEDKL